MTLFEFDITWNQTIREQFDQDDIKAIGTQRVETDDVRILAPTLELAEQALRRAFQHHKDFTIRTPPRKRNIHMVVEYSTKTLNPVPVSRTVGPEELNTFGKEIRRDSHR